LEDLSDFQRGQIVGAHLAGASVKSSSLWDYDRMHKSWEDIIS